MSRAVVGTNVQLMSRAELAASGDECWRRVTPHGRYRLHLAPDIINQLKVLGVKIV